MGLYEDVLLALKKKAAIQEYEELKNLYFQVTGKKYSSGCSGCAVKYLRAYLNNWIKSKQI